MKDNRALSDHGYSVLPDGTDTREPAEICVGGSGRLDATESFKFSQLLIESLQIVNFIFECVCYIAEFFHSTKALHKQSILESEEKMEVIN